MDWQPALINIHVHDSYPGKRPIDISVNPWTKVFIRPVSPPDCELQFRADTGCTGSQFYLLHPDDVARLDPNDRISAWYVCEHMVQTD